MITIYTKPDCVQCTATKREFDKAGVSYTEIDLTRNPHDIDLLKALGHHTAPVVFSGTSHWSGFRKDLICDAINTATLNAPPLQEPGRGAESQVQPLKPAKQHR